ncbi:hypothetical protein TRIUR3_03002 [Triticum urartu]|uniref:Uncharacterized protein n=1 Tax=Triticum urartu TaxID=4572 RepID=M7ZCP9_TRIUA|nr:hypothetical protein TRIUR3_03002 [Triticum urartu]
MDIISQLQEQLNEMAMAPPAPGAPPPAPVPPQPPQAPPQPALDLAEQPKAMSHALVLAAKKRE